MQLQYGGGIEYGLELLKKGAIWRVGSGESIRIWRDQWIPRETSLALVTKKRREIKFDGCQN
jgi:hypothetical protein